MLSHRSRGFAALILGLLTFSQPGWASDDVPNLPPAVRWWAMQEADAAKIRAGIRHLDQDWSAARYEKLDEAIEENIARHARLVKEGGFEPVERALKLDRALALAARGRGDEADRLLNELADVAPLPPYAMRAAGDVALRARRPLDAIKHYQEALAASPGDVSLHVSLAYAYLEAGDYEALELTLMEIERADGAALDTRLLRARMHRFSDQPSLAQRVLDGLSEEERHSLAGELETAALAQARGLPRAARAGFDRVAARSPGNVHAKIGQAETAWAMGALEEGKALTDELVGTMPEHPGVKRLVRSWESSSRARLSLEANAGQGHGRISGKDDLSTDLWLYSPLLGNGFRVFAHHHRVAADFDENRADHIRVGAGVELTRKNWRLAAELGSERTFARKETVSLRGSWQPSDGWEFRAGLDSRTDDVSVKGRYYYLGDFGADLSARRFSVGATRTEHESRRQSVDLGYYDFSDGNERATLTGTWFERVHNAPRHAVDLQVAAYASRNTRANAEYFNPQRDYALSATLVSDWLTWHDYDRRFNQRVAATLGGYRQLSGGAPVDSDYGWMGFGELRYEHEWRMGDDASARYGVGVRRFPYDGEHETRAYLYAVLGLRF